MNYKRLAGEPGDDYKRFTEFIKLPHPRSLKQLISKTGMSLQQLKRRCKKWHWIERAKTYDGQVLERTLEGELKGLEAVAKKEVVSHKEKITILLDLTWQKIVAYLKNDLLQPRDVMKLFVDLLKLGISKEELYVKLEEQRQSVDLSVLTDEQLRVLDEINEVLQVE